MPHATHVLITKPYFSVSYRGCAECYARESNLRPKMYTTNDWPARRRRHACSRKEEEEKMMGRAEKNIVPILAECERFSWKKGTS